MADDDRRVWVLVFKYVRRPCPWTLISFGAQWSSIQQAGMFFIPSCKFSFPYVRISAFLLQPCGGSRVRC